MYFDALTTAALADQFRAFVGARVQRVVQVDEWTIGLELYRPGLTTEDGERVPGQRIQVVASAHPQRSRVHLTRVKPRRGIDAPTPILLLLRKYVRGARLVGVEQPEFERILRLELLPPGELAEQHDHVSLVVEAMGRHANVILVDGTERVMDAIKRVTSRMSRVRPITPRRPYTLPPAQEKLDPPDLNELRLGALFKDAKEGQPAWRALVRGVRAVSPLLAREVLYRATGRADTPIGELRNAPLSPLLDAFHTLWMTLWERDWQPCVALEGGKVVAFAPYPLTLYETTEAADTISDAVDRYDQATTRFADDDDGPQDGSAADAYASARARTQALLEQAQKRVSKRRRSLERQIVSEKDIERLRQSGEMILAYSYSVRPGDRQLEAQVDLNGPPMVIALDPEFTAVENAQAYFARYEKAKSAAGEIPRLIARADLEAGYLGQLASDLRLAANRPEIDEVQTALQEAGYLPQQRGPRPQRGEPLRVQTDEGMLILVGRSARQNHELTFRRAAPEDLWLHAVDAPGSHVIIRSGGQPVPDAVLRRAAELAAYYSALRGESAVLVAYTPRRYVRPIRGARPGMVTYTHEQTLRVRPAR